MDALCLRLQRGRGVRGWEPWLESLVNRLGTLTDFLWKLEHLSVRLIAVIIRILIYAMGFVSAGGFLFRMVEAVMRSP